MLNLFTRLYSELQYILTEKPAVSSRDGILVSRVLFNEYRLEKYILTRFSYKIAQLLLAFVTLIALATIFPIASGVGLTHASEAPQPPRVEVEDALGQVARLKGHAIRLRASLDRSQLEFEALLDKLEFDAEHIAEYVAAQIYFEQYAGLLRGPQGTVLNRAGNALDQSVLLAKLLKDAGYEASVVRSTLSDEQADTLLKQLVVQRAARSGISDETKFQEVISELKKIRSGSDQRTAADSSTTPSSQPPIDKVLLDWSKDLTGVLIEQLIKESSGEGQSDVSAELAQEARDYFWVRFREGPADAWTDAHPAFGSSPPESMEVQIIEHYTDEIPQQLQHRIRLEAFIDRRLGNSNETHALMSPWERPAANVCGRTITYMNVPSGLRDISHLTPEQIARAIRESKQFFPALNANPPQGGQSFDLAGNLIDPMVAASMMAGVFKEVGSNFNEAGGGLSALGASTSNDDKTLAALSRQWLKITMIDPAGREKTSERTIFQRQANQDADVAALSVMASFTATCGSVSSLWVVDSYLRDLISIANALDGTEDQVGDEFNGGTNYLDLLYFHLSDHPLDVASGALSYRPEPSIVGSYRNIWIEGSTLRGFDIISNTRRNFIVRSGGIEASRNLAIQYGVWETALETLVVPWNPLEGFSTVQAFGGFSSDVPPAIRMINNPADLTDLELSPRIHGLLERDLRLGFVVALPQKISGGDTQLGWWRIEPRTGQTVGRIDTGWGSIMTEKVEELMAAMVQANAQAAMCAMRACTLIAGVAAVSVGVTAVYSAAEAIRAGDLGALQAIWEFAQNLGASSGVAALGGEKFMLTCLEQAFKNRMCGGTLLLPP